MARASFVRGPILYIIGLLLGVGLTYGWFQQNLFAPMAPGVTETTPFLVERGWNLKTICHALESNGLVRNWWATYFLARLQGKKLVENDISKVKPGEYSLSSGMSPKEILYKFIREEIVYHDLLVTEGSSLRDIATFMAKTTLASQADAWTALNNQSLMSKLGIPGTSLEGYLFPDTYRFSRPDNAEIMVMKMVEEHQKKVTNNRAYVNRAYELGMTMKEVITLASIIEKETGNADERKQISSVFHNRLKLNMPLQTDPTVIYGVPNFDGNLTKVHLRTPSPYNTYLNRGLPPTPICNPGIASIEAALYPADTDYVYFVARGDGTSVFSSNYREHQEAVRKYQSGKPVEQGAANP